MPITSRPRTHPQYPISHGRTTVNQESLRPQRPFEEHSVSALGQHYRGRAPSLPSLLPQVTLGRLSIYLKWRYARSHMYDRQRLSKARQAMVG